MSDYLVMLTAMLHPSFRLLLWCLVIALTQRAEGALALWCAALPVIAALGFARERALNLMRRARWLGLAIFCVFAWGTPGHLIAIEAAWLSPSTEGLHLAVTHLARLLAALSLVALLLQFTVVSQLVAGIYTLMRPLRGLGIDPARAALRLELVLRYTTSTRSQASWREWLTTPITEHHAPVRLQLTRPGPPDACALALVLFTLWWLS